jgi:hypothetical protein
MHTDVMPPFWGPDGTDTPIFVQSFGLVTDLLEGFSGRTMAGYGQQVVASWWGNVFRKHITLLSVTVSGKQLPLISNFMYSAIVRNISLLSSIVFHFR